MSLLPVADAQARLLDMAKALPVEQASLTEAAGRWLAADLVALRDQPWADLSAMDGYAIRFDDMPGPWTLTGESAAGALTPPAVAGGSAVRIFTGAPVPAGADTVIVQEDVAADGATIRLTGDGPAARARHIRSRGSDFHAGATILTAGTRINAGQIALAALAGHAAVPVPVRPRIALLSTGSELAPVGEPPRKGMLPASNAPMLAALLRQLPCFVTNLGIIPDDLAATRDAMEAACGFDIIVTTGGASVGDHDLVRPALEAAGGRIDFWKIRMRPGKPLISGTLGDGLFLGLPGNPVSAFVTARLFLVPLVRHLCGCPEPLPRFTPMPLAAALPAVGGRDDFLRARVVDGAVAPLAQQDSAAVLSLARADALIHRPAGSHPAAAGEPVEVLRL
ncbi:molybdopterin molybdotransferase MoeA [Sphingobium subterraneum]|uniref:Molybdopterin molybdenumtransferase n=1 Tax=Sphingobium subterraneum TaxID=627688 RepID=A0A841IWW2_9SPHN|nr:gephyrin-like molybdotransferase Glp [Sphingobium subterraneum]MBB6122632.1 molybdopterin molybdotransferase [Sphingobium subterraneum]